jgi:hypothetical protein
VALTTHLTLGPRLSICCAVPLPALGVAVMFKGAAFTFPLEFSQKSKLLGRGFCLSLYLTISSTPIWVTIHVCTTWFSNKGLHFTSKIFKFYTIARTKSIYNY